MLELALHWGEGPVQLETLAEGQAMPLRYLAEIAGDLRRGGLIRSIRGAHGGYVLAREPADIQLVDVVQCLEGSVAPVPCVDDPGMCDRQSTCVARDVWLEVNDAIIGVLSSVNLQDLARRCVEKAARAPEEG